VGVRAQTLQVGRNLAAVLDSRGAQLTDVLKVTAYLTDVQHFDEFNSAYMEIFDAPYPARTTVFTGLRGILVEFDAIAECPGDGTEE
jgi:2-iminobutanoate/2-iminopropanoate deaminase